MICALPLLIRPCLPIPLQPQQDLLKGHTRITLSPVQVAQYLTQNGVFEHEGETYVDHHHRRTNENLFHHLLGRGLSMGARWVSKSGISVADVHDKITHYPLSPNYEFAMADVVSVGLWNGLRAREIVTGH